MTGWADFVFDDPICGRSYPGKVAGEPLYCTRKPHDVHYSMCADFALGVCWWSCDDRG